jgi:secreted trypsin-like serine protease
MPTTERRPWMTFIQISNKNKKAKVHCGGSIINNYWILSAAHCFCEHLECKPSKEGSLEIAYKPKDYIRINTGLKDVDQINSDKPDQVSTPENIFIHPL